MKTFLQTLGLRTDCCNAKIITWHRDKHYCQHCERWLEQLLLTDHKPVKKRHRNFIRWARS